MLAACIESHGICNQKSNTAVPVAPQKVLVSSRLKQKTTFNSNQILENKHVMEIVLLSANY